jgi:hypothetical protein
MVNGPEQVEVGGIVWSDEIEAHFARHDVSYTDILTVLTRNPLGFRNLEGRGGTHVVIGPDLRGRILYISLRPTSEPAVWEPVTGWESRSLVDSGEKNEVSSGQDT